MPGNSMEDRPFHPSPSDNDVALTAQQVATFDSPDMIEEFHELQEHERQDSE